MKTWKDGNGKPCYDLNSMHKGNRFRLMFGLPLLPEYSMKIEPPRLVSITKMVENMTPEEAICYMARVSSPQNQDKHDTSYKLLRYLLLNSHWSPFDMIHLTMEIHVTRSTMAQILRHWSFDFQELSQRYATVELMDWSHLEARQKAKGGNRQGSAERSTVGTFHLNQSCKASEAAYNHLVHDLEISPETAREALPLGTVTRAYMSGSVRSWITYFWQRGSMHDCHAQKEHRTFADGAFAIFKEPFPNIATIVEEGMPRYVSKEEWELVKAARV